VVKGRKILAAAALGLGLAAAAVGAPAKRAAPAPAPAAPKLMQSCDAHKFETIVTATVDGQPHQSKVKLCGNEGQSDAEWIGTLKDAIAKLDANKEMSAAVRDQIVTAINAEIARLQTVSIGPRKEQASIGPSIAPLPPRPTPVPSTQMADEYSSLPPLPTAPPQPPRVMGPGAITSVAATSARAKSPPLPLATGPAPKLSFACYSPGDVGSDAPCDQFGRETVLTVRAGEDIGGGIQLRFQRNGEERATIELAELTRGKSMRISLPREVCQGFVDGRLDLLLVKDGALLKSDGPYNLRC